MATITEARVKKMIAAVPQVNRDAVRRFDEENKASGLVISSRLNYLRALSLLASHVNKPFKEMKKEDIVSWVSGLELAPSTINLYKALSKRFFQWLYGCEKREYPDVVKWITTKRGKRNTIEVLTLDEVKRMTETATNQRDRALIMLAYESGCRADEILKIKIRDVKMDKYGAVCMVNGKTGGRRIRLIDAVPDMQLWIGMHPEKDNPDAPLWIAQRKGYDLRYVQFYTILTQAGKKAGIKKRVYPHLLRHSRLTELATKLTDSELKVFAGWQGDSRMPGVYIHLSGADIDKKILGIHGLVEEKEKVEERPLTPRMCPRCETKNPATAKFCSTCSAVLDLKTAITLDDAKRQPGDVMNELIKDPEVMALLERKISEMS